VPSFYVGRHLVILQPRQGKKNGLKESDAVDTNAVLITPSSVTALEIECGPTEITTMRTQCKETQRQVQSTNEACTSLVDRAGSLWNGRTLYAAELCRILTGLDSK